jgi:hypothetical protein
LLFTFFLLLIQRKVLVEANADPILIKKKFLIYKGAKSNKMKDFPIYEEMRKFFTIYEEAVSHV